MNNKPKSEPETLPLIILLTSLSLPVSSSLEPLCINAVPERVVLLCGSVDVIAEPEPEHESTPLPTPSTNATIPSLPVPLSAGNATENTEPKPKCHAPTTSVPEPSTSLPQSPSTDDVPELLCTLPVPTFVSLAPSSVPLTPSEITLPPPPQFEIPTLSLNLSSPALSPLSDVPSCYPEDHLISPLTIDPPHVALPASHEMRPVLLGQSLMLSNIERKPSLSFVNSASSELVSESCKFVSLPSPHEVSNTPIPAQSMPQEQAVSHEIKNYALVSASIKRARATVCAQVHLFWPFVFILSFDRRSFKFEVRSSKVVAERNPSHCSDAIPQNFRVECFYFLPPVVISFTTMTARTHAS